MEEELISQRLRELPRHEASPYFTAGVLRRLREGPRRRPFQRPLRRLAMAAATAATLVVGIFGAHQLAEERERQQERRQALVRLETLEQQKAQLENEIRSLRRLARDAQPVVYLGSTPRVDVVVDLRRLAQRSRAAGVRPASFPSQQGIAAQPIGDHR